MGDFYNTRMGQTHYLGTMPRIAKSLETIAEEMGRPRKLSKSLLDSFTSVLELADNYMEAMRDDEDSDTVGQWDVDIQRVSDYVKETLEK